MQRRNQLSASERLAAEALNRHLDEIADGVLAPGNELDPELAATVSRVSSGVRRDRSSPALKNQIWEDLMSTSALDIGKRRAPKQTGTDAGIPLPASIHPRPIRQMAAVAAMLALSIGLVAALIYSGGRGSTPAPTETSANAPFFVSPIAGTPRAVAFTGPIADPAGCTTASLRLNEISAILAMATSGQIDHDTDAHTQRGLPPEIISIQRIGLPLPQGTSVDNATKAAVENVFNQYWECGNTGALRRQLYLMTDSGVARAFFNPNGVPVWGAVVNIGVDTAAPSPASYQHIPEITSIRALGDGRVAIEFQRYQDQPDLVGLMVFRQISGTWYIDQYDCEACG